MEALDTIRPVASVPDARLTVPIATPRRHTALWLLFALLLLYLPAVSGNYAFSDDYPFLWQGVPWPVFVRIGRPLTGLFLLGCAELIRLTHGTGLCHVLGLAGALALGLATYRWLRFNRQPPVRALLVTLLLLSLPSVQLYVCWTNTTSSLYAALLATLALLVFRKALISTERPAPARWWASATAAGVLLVLAMLTYQPAALYYWSLAAVPLLPVERLDGKSLRRVLAPTFLVGAAGMVAYFILYKGMLLFSAADASERAVLASDYHAKATWFLREPLRNALSLWSLAHTVPYFARAAAGLIALGALVNLLQACLGRRRPTSDFPLLPPAGEPRARALLGAAGKWAVLLALLPLSYLFNLAVAESWPSYRSLFALASTALILCLASAERLCALVPRARREQVLIGFLSFCAVFAAVKCGTGIMNYVIVPQAVEYDVVKALLYQYDLSRTDRIHVIQPEGYQSLAPGCYYDEFGVPSLRADWVPVAMVGRALEHLGLDPDRYHVTYGRGSDNLPTAPNAIVLDLRKLAWLRE